MLSRTGRVADYIPALARVDPRKLGIAIVTTDGTVVSAGDAYESFSIQSISKVFMLALAAGRSGPTLWDRVGREPSGSAFNSIVQLEHERGIPRNPFINAGAIVTADMCLGEGSADNVVNALLDFIRNAAAGTSIYIDAEVTRSEAQTGHRNRALAHFMRAEGNLMNEPASTLSVYFRQCAVAMTCVQLARAGLFLATGGVDPLTQREVVPSERARRLNALMLTCGHYDASGDFAFRVGLPGKSGVGGGILAIAPGKAAMAVWSPGLNENGNSLAGSLMLEHLAMQTGWSVFA